METPGIDEVAPRQGHGHDVAVVRARDAAGTTPGLAVRPDRLQATVPALLEGLPAAWKTTGRRACMDRGDGDAGAVAAALPRAHIVVGRFPVAVHSRQAADDLRQAECRRPNAGRPADRAVPTAQLRPLVRRAWRSLNADRQGPLVEWFDQTPTLASADVRRTLLTAIVDRTPDRATAPTRLPRWGEPAKAAGITGFDPLLNTLHHGPDGILNDVDGRHPSGFVEGLNHQPKRLKRRCFGLDDPVERFRRLWPDLEGARRWA